MLSQEAFDTLFFNARTYNSWDGREVPDELLVRLYDTLKMGPTAMNGLPGRFVFIKSSEGKQRLEPHLSEGNREKTLAAPMTVIVAYDTQFYQHLPRLFPAYDARPMYRENPDKAELAAFRNGTLQGGYLILAARALGLDAGPMSGFDNAGVDAEFFPEGRYRSNFLVNLGYGTPDGLYPRGERLDFADACQIA